MLSKLSYDVSLLKYFLYRQHSFSVLRFEELWLMWPNVYVLVLHKLSFIVLCCGPL